MKYTIKYITSIAEHKFGKSDKKAIEKYIADFNPKLPEFIEDEKNYNLHVEYENAKQEENQFRYRILQDSRYMKIVYGIDPYNIYENRLKNIESMVADDPFKLKEVLLTSPVTYDKNKHYTLYVSEIQNKYGFHHDADSIIKVVSDISKTENATDTYKSYYKMLFALTYLQANQKDVDILELYTDYDNMMSDILKEEIVPLENNNIDIDAVQHGGLKGNELIKFINSYVEDFEDVKQSPTRESKIRDSLVEKSK